MRRISAPKNLCIYSNETSVSTFQFLHRLDQQLNNLSNSITIDLSAVKFITASVSLIMFAFVNKAQLLAPNPSYIKFTLPKREENDSEMIGYQLIVQTGLAKALFAHNAERIAELQQTNRLFQTSDTPHTAVKTTKKLLEAVSDSTIPPELMQRIEAAISEAVLNVLHHSYEREIDKKLKEAIGARWWQCAWSTEQNGRKVVYFLIYDLGQGIVRSYTGIKKFTGTQTAALFHLNTLNEAMSMGKTRFGPLSGRGNGSEDIKYPTKTDAHIESELLVFSGNSIYNVDGENTDAKMQWSDLSLPGTLLEWSFSVEIEES